MSDCLNVSVNVCSKVTFTFISMLKFDIVPMVTQMQRIGTHTILCIYICVTINIVLTFDANINVDTLHANGPLAL